jgi:hypothetical protein
MSRRTAILGGWRRRLVQHLSEGDDPALTGSTARSVNVEPHSWPLHRSNDTVSMTWRSVDRVTGRVAGIAYRFRDAVGIRSGMFSGLPARRRDEAAAPGRRHPASFRLFLRGKVDPGATLFMASERARHGSRGFSPLSGNDEEDSRTAPVPPCHGSSNDPSHARMTTQSHH